MSSVSEDPDTGIPPAEVPDLPPPHAHGFWSRWVFSQDAKYIALQREALYQGKQGGVNRRHKILWFFCFLNKKQQY